MSIIIKKIVVFGLILLMVFCSACGLSAEEKEALQGLSEMAGKLKDIADEPLPDTSNCFIQFTISGHSGGTYRVEGEEAVDSVGMMPRDGNVFLSFSVYDANSKTKLDVLGAVNPEEAAEQAVPATVITGCRVDFNCGESEQTPKNWQDHFDLMLHPLFFGDPDDPDAFNSYWLIQSEQASKSRVRYRGSVTFKASNSPLDSSAENADQALAEAVLADCFENKGRIPPYSAELAGVTEISVRCDFDVIVVDMGFLEGLSE